MTNWSNPKVLAEGPQAGPNPHSPGLRRPQL